MLQKILIINTLHILITGPHMALLVFIYVLIYSFINSLIVLQFRTMKLHSLKTKS